MRIAEAVKHALSRSDILLCSGGLGPTVDDVSREGIARALDLKLEFHEEIWEKLHKRYARFKRTPTENNKRQAYLPQGAKAMENAVGTAPGVLIEKDDKVIICMPGVPSEMKYIFEHGVMPYFEKRYGKGAIIRARVLHVAGVPESQIDEKLDDLERLENPTVGLAAHAGSVDVRLTAKGTSVEKAVEMLADLEEKAMHRLGDWVYGADEDTLARVVLTQLTSVQKHLAVIEKGLDGALVKALTGQGNAFVGGEIQSAEMKAKPLPELTKQYASEVHADVILGVRLSGSDDRNKLELVIVGLDKEHKYSFSNGGHSADAPEWGVNLSLSILRRQLLKADLSSAEAEPTP